MKKIDRLIRRQLVKEAKKAKMEPGNNCLSDKELREYISKTIDLKKKEAMEEHMADCLFCLDKLVAAYEGEKLFSKRKIKPPHKHIEWRARNIERTGEDFTLLQGPQKFSATEKTVTKWLPRNLRKNRWLIASITAFTLSFAFPSVFLQFLLAAGILGGKWIFDSENTKMLIMIYNAWKKGGEKEAGEMISSLKDRISNRKSA